MNRLEDERALITGGTTGIGLETARQVRGRNPETLDGARRALGSEGRVIPSDASDPAAQPIGKAFGGLDAVFVNASAAELRPIEHWDEGGFDRSFSLNLQRPLLLIQALLPLFL